ncbi:MAG: ARMT1-like domain-containing protein [Acidobacteriota bacterium]
MVQRIHRRLREIIGVDDPYCEIKKYHNRMALNLFPELQGRIAGWDPGSFMFRQRKFF